MINYIFFVKTKLMNMSLEEYMLRTDTVSPVHVSITDYLITLMKGEEPNANHHETNILQDIGVFSEGFSEFPTIFTNMEELGQEFSNIFNVPGIDTNEILTMPRDNDQSSQILFSYNNERTCFIITYEPMFDEELEEHEYVITQRFIEKIFHDILDLGIRLYTCDTF